MTSKLIFKPKTRLTLSLQLDTDLTSLPLFLKQFYGRRTNGTTCPDSSEFGFAATHKADPSAKPKELFFATAPTRMLPLKTINN